MTCKTYMVYINWYIPRLKSTPSARPRSFQTLLRNAEIHRQCRSPEPSSVQIFVACHKWRRHRWKCRQEVWLFQRRPCQQPPKFLPASGAWDVLITLPLPLQISRSPSAFIGMSWELKWGMKLSVFIDCCVFTVKVNSCYAGMYFGVSVLLSAHRVHTLW